MVQSDATGVVTLALRRGMRPHDSALIRLALTTIVLRRRRKAKKAKRVSGESVLFHSLPPLASKARPDHLCNVFSMAEQQVKVNDASRALSLGKYAALQLSEMDAETRNTWIHQFLMENTTTKHSLALWNQILHLTPPTPRMMIASDVLAVTLDNMTDTRNDNDDGESNSASPHWFFLAELCIPHAPIEQVEAAWQQLADMTAIVLPRSSGSMATLATHAQMVLTEQLHARLRHEKQQQWNSCSRSR